MRWGRQRGFTMVEIAIALGVIGFALVAIIGILPAGLEVQRDNRTETVLNQDGTLWLEAIRNGARGMDDLTNYVDRIEIAGAPGSPFVNFTRGDEIIGLLTRAVDPGTDVRAFVWAISGSAADKEPARANRALAFKYRMAVHIDRATNFAVPFPALATNVLGGIADPLATLYHIRLAFSYPLVADENKDTPRRQSFRGLASRYLIATNDPLGRLVYYFTDNPPR